MLLKWPHAGVLDFEMALFAHAHLCRFVDAWESGIQLRREVHFNNGLLSCMNE
jgi:hypothetical protein